MTIPTIGRRLGPSTLQSGCAESATFEQIKKWHHGFNSKSSKSCQTTNMFWTKDQFNLEMWKRCATWKRMLPPTKGTVLIVILKKMRFPTLVEWIMDDVFDILPTLGNLPQPSINYNKCCILPWIPLLKQITSTQSPQQSSKHDHVHPSIGIPITDSSLTA